MLQRGPSFSSPPLSESSQPGHQAWAWSGKSSEDSSHQPPAPPTLLVPSGAGASQPCPDHRGMSTVIVLEAWVSRGVFVLFVWYAAIGNQNKVQYDSVEDPYLNPLNYATEVKGFLHIPCPHAWRCNFPLHSSTCTRLLENSSSSFLLYFPWPVGCIFKYVEKEPNKLFLVLDEVYHGGWKYK